MQGMTISLKNQMESSHHRKQEDLQMRELVLEEWIKIPLFSGLESTGSSSHVNKVTKKMCEETKFSDDWNVGTW